MFWSVTGSDISQAAIRRAKEVYRREENVRFVVDNILHSNFKEAEFDYIFDRGCFHVLDPSDRLTYIREIKRIPQRRWHIVSKVFLVLMKKEEKDRTDFLKSR